jgi:predicted nucleic acid-binding protein
MILVDTSVWVDHLRRHNAGLADLLSHGRVVVHPFVIGEVSLGHLRHRGEVLGLLSELPVASVASHDEALEIAERSGLAGVGVGWVDAHLVASALIGRHPLWTLDRRLDRVARRLGVARTQ